MALSNESITSTLSIFRVEEQGREFDRAVMEPLPRGYGHTVGNSLRRMMLSSLSGLAVVRVDIEGVQHMYDTMPDVTEDVLDLCSNLKRLKLAGSIGESVVAVRAFIDKKGAGDVTAADIQGLPGTITLPNPDYKLCTLGKSGHLRMELFIEEGQGYESWEQRRERNPEEPIEVGHLGLDATYSPVLRIAYRVEQTRFERRVDLDRLIFEIETDETISTREAIEQSAQMLVSQLHVLTGAVEREQEATEKSLLESDIDDLALEQPKIYSILHENGIHTLGELTSKSRKDLEGIPKLGKKSLDRIVLALEAKDLALAE